MILFCHLPIAFHRYFGYEEWFETHRTNAYTLATQTALLMIDVSQIVLNGDCSESTFLLALTATNTTNGASLHGYRSFILVYARHEYPAILRPLLTEFDDVTRTSLYTSTARCTLVVINLRKIGVSDIAKLLLGKIGNADYGHITFNFNPLVVLAITEAFNNLAHD